jgi:putative DNA primase/helicase
MVCGGPATLREGAAGVLLTCAPCDLTDADPDHCQELMEQRWRADVRAMGAAGEREIAALIALPRTPSSEAIERALRALADSLTGADPLRVEIAREAARVALEGKAKGPARLVDAALGLSRDADAGAAESLGIADPDAWAEPVNGAELLTELEKSFCRHLELPEGAATVLALWTLHTWALDAFSISPRLGVLSPTKQCGKTTLLDLLALLTRRPLPAVNVTEATLFRVVEEVSPTFLIDEADRHLDVNAPSW